MNFKNWKNHVNNHKLSKKIFRLKGEASLWKEQTVALPIIDGKRKRTVQDSSSAENNSAAALKEFTPQKLMMASIAPEEVDLIGWVSAPRGGFVMNGTLRDELTVLVDSSIWGQMVYKDLLLHLLYKTNNSPLSTALFLVCFWLCDEFRVGATDTLTVKKHSAVGEAEIKFRMDQEVVFNFKLGPDLQFLVCALPKNSGMETLILDVRMFGNKTLVEELGYEFMNIKAFKVRVNFHERSDVGELLPFSPLCPKKLWESTT